MIPPKYRQPVKPRFVGEAEGLFSGITADDLFRTVKSYDRKLETLCTDLFYSLTSENLEDHLNIEVVGKKEFDERVDWGGLRRTYPELKQEELVCNFDYGSATLLYRAPQRRQVVYKDIGHEFGHYLEHSPDILAEEINAVIFEEWALKKLEIETGMKVEISEKLTGIHKIASEEAKKIIIKNGFQKLASEK